MPDMRHLFDCIDRRDGSGFGACLTGEVVYTLPAGRQARLEFLNRIGWRDGRTGSYRIFIDASPMFAALEGAR